LQFVSSSSITFGLWLHYHLFLSNRFIWH
jgi:hypothetical protein